MHSHCRCWVELRSLAARPSCRFDSQQQTLSGYTLRFEKCHDRTSRLFDHGVGAGEHHGRYFEAKRLSRLKIDDQFVSGGCLNREIGGFLSLQNAIYISCSEPRGCNEVRSVGNKASVIYERRKRQVTDIALPV